MPTYALKKSGLLTVLCVLATAVAAQTKPVVVLIATGGTIAMKIDPVKHAPVPAISGEDLLATVPQVSKYATVEVKNVSNVPSDYMDPVRWTALTRDVDTALARPEVAGVIISHGTDTLEETAYWLDLTVDSDKPVVLIGECGTGKSHLATALCLAACRQKRRIRFTTAAALVNDLNGFGLHIRPFKMKQWHALILADPGAS